MTDDLVAFLTSRLDETEADARDAAGTDALGTPSSGVWTYVETPGGDHKVIDDTGHTVSGHYEVGSHPWDTGPHIARHDPARVLRDVAATRAIIKEHDPKAWSGTPADRCPTCTDDTYSPDRPLERALTPCATLRHLAAEHADHPDYKETWRLA